jgi:uncharacterized protein
MLNRISDRIASLDWVALQHLLDVQGFAKLPTLLDPDQCQEIIKTYDDTSL